MQKNLQLPIYNFQSISNDSNIENWPLEHSMEIEHCKLKISATLYSMDFIAIGDTTVDEFIKLKEAHVSCDVNHEECTISMRWGDKIPYELSVLVPGVGNAANAAVAAARLGLSSGLISNVGNDHYGKEILATFKREG